MNRFWPLLVLLLACRLAPAAEVIPAEGTVQALFSPWDDVEGEVLRCIANAKSTLHVQAYLLTSRSIAKALADASKRGVQVKVLADAEMALKGESSQIPQLREAGIPVWLEVRYVNAHNKILLIDAETLHPIVITGSYNFTWSAQARNAENLLVLRDNRPLAARYLANWQRHQREAQPFPEKP